MYQSCPLSLMCSVECSTHTAVPVQVAAIKTQIGELRAGIGRVNDEILAAAGLGSAAEEAHAAFRDHMVAFQRGAQPQFAELEVCGVPCYLVLIDVALKLIPLKKAHLRGETASCNKTHVTIGVHAAAARPQNAKMTQRWRTPGCRSRRRRPCSTCGTRPPTAASPSTRPTPAARCASCATS